MSRFDPTPDAEYGHCTNCDEKFATQDAARAHMSQTMDEALAKGESRGHAVRITNAPRADRIRSAIAGLVDDAMYRAVEDVLEDVGRYLDRGELTEDEVREALRPHSHEFSDGFEEWLR